MKRMMLLCLLLAIATTSVAQMNSSDVPTKEDINRFLDAMQIRQQMQAMMTTMRVQVKANARQMLQKNMPNATNEDLARAEQFMDQALNEPIPVDEYINVMIPVYQRHLTRNDIDGIVAFYSSPVGQKMLREMPAMVAEGMQAASKITQEHMEKVMARMRARMNETPNSPPQSNK